MSHVQHPEKPTREKAELIGGALEECIRDCQKCEAECLELVTHCLAKGGEHAAPEHIRLLLDCADICGLSARFMVRRSDAHPLTCGACAEVCLRCAEDCQRFQDDEMMMRCAEVCRQCADSCRQMAGASGAV